MLTGDETKKLRGIIRDIAKKAEKIVLQPAGDMGNINFNISAFISRTKVLNIQATYVKLIIEFMHIIENFNNLLDSVPKLKEMTIYSIKDCIHPRNVEEDGSNMEWGQVEAMCSHIEKFIKDFDQITGTIRKII